MSSESIFLKNLPISVSISKPLSVDELVLEMNENDVPKIELKLGILSFLHNNTEVEIILCLSSITLIG